MNPAPRIRAICSATPATPPEPRASTVSPVPAGDSQPTSACQAVTAAQGNVAASANVKGPGILATALAGNTAVSDRPPSQGAAERAGQVGVPPRAAGPVREEPACHAVPWLQIPDVRGDLRHLARPVRQRHQSRPLRLARFPRAAQLHVP